MAPSGQMIRTLPTSSSAPSPTWTSAGPLDELIDGGAIFVASSPDPWTQRLIVDEVAGLRWGGASEPGSQQGESDLRDVYFYDRGAEPDSKLTSVGQKL
jgi:hypothetical protein